MVFRLGLLAVFLFLLNFLLTFISLLLLYEPPLLQDAKFLVQLVEDTHPAFLDIEPLQDYPKEEYYKAKEQLLCKAAERDLCTESFYFLCQHLLATLSDIHTRMNIPAGEYRYLDVNFICKDNKTFLARGEQYSEDAEVVAIGKVPLSLIYDVIDSHIPHESEGGKLYNRERYLRYEAFHLLAGADAGDEISIELLSATGKVSEIAISYNLLQMGEHGASEVVTLSSADNDATDIQPPFINTECILLEEESVLLVIIHSCVYDTSLVTTLAMFDQALLNGVKKIVFDVRDNPGGVSSFWSHFFSYMMLNPGSYGKIERYSKQNYRSPNSFGMSLEMPQPAPQQECDLQIIVLVNEETYSGAVWLATLISDANLGLVIGREPGNAASMFGNFVAFSLPNSSLQGVISTSFFQRPEPARDTLGGSLMDIIVPHGEDILQTALLYFRD